MGSNLNVYIGPYALCRVEKVTKEREDFGCSKCDKVAGWRRDDAFCPACGTKLGPITVEIVVDEVNPWDLNVEEFDERLFPNDDLEGLHAWMPNIRMGNGFRETTYSAHDYPEEPVALKEGQVSQEMELFEEAFSDELDTLRKHYGPSAVEIVWGIVPYWL